MFWNGYILIIQGFPSIPKILLFLIPRLLHYDPKLSLKMSLLNWHSSSLKSFEYWEGLLFFSLGSPCLVLISSGTHWPVRPPSRTFTLKCSRNNFVISISFCDGKTKMHENTNFMVYKHFHVVFQSSLMTYLTGVRSE